MIAGVSILKVRIEELRVERRNLVAPPVSIRRLRGLAVARQSHERE
jgi:hypothetical protein